MRRLIVASLTALSVYASAGLTDAHAASENSAQETLQQQIEKAAAGSTLVLAPGVYEGPIILSKPIRIEAPAEGAVTIVNHTDEAAIMIQSEHAAIVGIEIVDNGVKETAAVHVKGAHAWLERLRITTEAHGIMLEDADDSVMINNTIHAGELSIAKLVEKGNGIDLFNSHRVRITGNSITLMHDGIYAENSEDTFIEGNYIELSRYGIHCMYTSGTVIQNNHGSMNITGSMIMAARQTKVSGNIFEKQSENVNSQGILLFNAHESEITNNIISGNRIGFYVEYSTNNMLSDNEVSYNFIGLQLADSSQNTITGNQFIGNVSDATAKGSESNELRGNYWDSFAGIDADGDGYSDISYAINPFFQSLVQKRPPFQLFFRAPGIVFVEGLYSASRLEWSTDTSPRMSPSLALPSNDSQHSSWKTGVTAAALLLSALSVVLLSRRKSE